MLRLDLLHPIVSGNKWFKLKHNAAAALAAGKKRLLTFGGGYSNHLVATAFVAKEMGLRSMGIVRGCYPEPQLTPSLLACRRYGMELDCKTKAAYAAVSLAALAHAYPDAHILPEGGANDEGVRGASEITRYIPEGTTDVCVPIGTGTTLRGLLEGLPKHTRVHGFYVARDIKRMDPLLREVQSSSGPNLSVHAVANARFGKWDSQALEFIENFRVATEVPLDVVYTSKMMMKVEELLRNACFSASSRVVCIHTGGLQGNPPGLFSVPESAGARP